MITNDTLAHVNVAAEPLGMLDCSPISDGAAAAVVCSAEGLRRLRLNRADCPEVRAIGLVSGTLRTGLYDLNEEDISRRAGSQAYEAAGIDPGDIDVVEMHDCFTIAEIVRLEGLGLIPRGEGAYWTASGRTSLGGQLPVNTSGGLLSRGHPVGATGVAQLCELSWQLTGRAARRQVAGAKLGLAYCKGGTVAGTDGGSVTTVVLSR